MLVPSPLSAGSPLLRERRYEVDVCGPKNSRGGRLVLATGRFTNLDTAKRWADEVHGDAEVVTVTFLSAKTGWRPQHAMRRKDGEWS